MLTHKEDHIASPNKQLIVIIQPNGLFHLDWQAVPQSPSSSEMAVQDEIYKRYSEHSEDFFFWLGFREKSEALSDSLCYLITIAAMFVRKLSKQPDIESLRQHSVVELEAEDKQYLLQKAPFLIGSQYLDVYWVEEAWDALHRAFSIRLESHDGSIAQLYASSDATMHLPGRVYFHLVENKKEGEYPFSFLSTYAADAPTEGKFRHLPLKNALIEYGENSGKLLELLSTVSKASENSAFISELLDSGDIFHPIGLTANEAYTFLTEVLMYEEAGILCRIPKWWKNKSDALKVSVSVGGKQPSHVSMEALIGFEAELWLAGEAVTVEELKHLLSEEEGLAFIKGKWVEVNHKRLQEALKAYEQAQKMIGNSGMTVVEAMRLQLNAAKMLDISEEAVELEITNGQWLDSVMNRLANPEEIEPITTEGHDFHANLRTYQERGVSWLHYMKTLGLGACLADDMGLGKTVQVIALLNFIRVHKKEKTLLVVPASLIGNWMSEIEKFAPSLKYYVYHPSENKAIDENDGNLEEHELFITTYGMLLKYEWLTERSWDTLILDEAQAIKNPGTKQTKLVKQIKASYKIAMTGTPIENRLSDLWSLFDFLNKGLLGTAKEFTQFAKNMRDSIDGYTRLKKVVSPFILRRLKTDKTIISDLPDKVEMKTYSTLSKNR
ncbi:SNF2-related protein [Paenibacillus sp. N3.4]|uniref:SNF2-related protein n=1 Tax=Paenibacillus sp. N3.4 TaxID=2603222 RepID=UPI001C9D2445|nr:SNF2-related protein [Paenibacillus sp. N3.4]